MAATWPWVQFEPVLVLLPSPNHRHDDKPPVRPKLWLAELQVVSDEVDDLTNAVI